MRTLGETISSQRRIKGFSQELLAEKCGTSLRTIQRIENNTSKPRAYTLKMIADILAIDLSKLDVYAESVTPESVISGNTLSKINSINSSALLGILLPCFNLIAPGVLWYLNRKNPVVNEKSKKIISFQLLWSLATLFILLTIHYLHFKTTGQFSSETISAEFIGYLLLLLINSYFVIKNAFLLRDGNPQIYPSIPSLV